MKAPRWVRTIGFLLPAVLVGPDIQAQSRNPGADLVEAAKAGNRDSAFALLDEGSAANVSGPDGTTALMWAARQDDVELADRLIRSGAGPRASNRYGVTALYLAAVNGSAAMIARLLDAGADPNEVGTEGETVLMTAARTGRVEAARVLLEGGAEVDLREDWHGQTALMWAAAQGHPEMVGELVRRGADPNARSSIEEWERQRTAEPRDKWLPPGGLTPLLFAAREDCVACIPVLVNAGADVNATTLDGISPLLMAVINGHYDAAAALIEHGTDPNLADYTGRTALYAAVDFNTMPASNRPAPAVLENSLSALDLVHRLLDRGADPNVQLARQAPYRTKLDRGDDTMLTTGTTPLLRAAKAGDAAAMALLLAYGADATLATRAGINPLMAAAGLGTKEEDTTGRSKTGEAAVEAIRLSLAAGVDINAADGRGQTALHGAALQGFDRVVQFLADNGADLEAEDREGLTPLDWALGLAGGLGFDGSSSVVHQSTADLLRRLTAERTAASAERVR